jgi:hypothetical protein
MICKFKISRWNFNLLFRNRTGSIRLLSMKMALTLLCRGNIEEKYRCKLIRYVNMFLSIYVFRYILFGNIWKWWSKCSWSTTTINFIPSSYRRMYIFSGFFWKGKFNWYLDSKTTWWSSSIRWIKCWTECSKLFWICKKISIRI